MDLPKGINEAKLIAFLDGKLSPEEASEVEAWYDMAEENRDTLERLYVALFARDRLDAVKNIDPYRALSQFKSRIAEKQAAIKAGRARRTYQIQRWRRMAGGVAAILVAAVMLVTGLTVYPHLQRADWCEVYADAATATRVVLPDGSTVDLGPNSSISYPKDFLTKERVVCLDGEAFLDVAKRDGMPFRVEAHETKVEVRGTKFNVKAHKARPYIEVVLLEGAIDFCATRQNIAVAPDQKVVYDRNGRRISVTTVDAQMEIFGTHTFDEKMLAEVAVVLERIYGCKISFADERFPRIVFSGTISRQNTMEHTLEVITLSTGLKFGMNGNEIVICE